jgi:hypothetical protein
VSSGSTEGTGAGAPVSEEELRAAYEAEIKKIRVDQVLLENVVTLVNLGMRRTGMSPGTEEERDLGQVRITIESIRALLPIIEQSAAQQAGPIRDALSQLQLAFVRLGGAPAPQGAAAGATGEADPAGGSPAGSGEASQPPPPKPGEPGPAQRSGRLWVPGQS